MQVTLIYFLFNLLILLQHDDSSQQLIVCLRRALPLLSALTLRFIALILDPVGEKIYPSYVCVYTRVGFRKLDSRAVYIDIDSRFFDVKISAMQLSDVNLIDLYRNALQFVCLCCFLAAD